MATTRRADARWQGSLMEGSGVVAASSSSAFSDLPVTWKARTAESEGKTSPEELIAAAHASCFAMALSHALSTAGTPPQQLDVSASVTFDNVGGGFKITSSRLTVQGVVPGIDAAGFQQAAEGAKDGCPVSQALKGNVELSVEASLGA